MAETHGNAKLALTTSFQTIGGAVPSLTKRLIYSAQVANIDGTNSVDVSAQWLDSSDSDTATSLANLIACPAKTAIGLLDGTLALMTGDQLQAKASANSDAVLTISYVDIT